MNIRLFGKEISLPHESTAYMDPLTGVLNRRVISDALPAVLKRRGGTQRDTRSGGKLLAVIMSDLDGFKAINDLYGHSAGDHILIEFARRMKEHLRVSDTLIRYGGDEFLVLLMLRQDSVRKVITRILSGIQNRPVDIVAANGKEARVFIKISMGVCLIDPARIDSEETWESLVAESDRLMYKTKFSIGPGFSVSSWSPGGWIEASRQGEPMLCSGGVPVLEALVDILHQSDGYAKTYSYKSRDMMAKFLSWGVTEGRTLFSSALPGIYDWACRDVGARKMIVDLAAYHDVGNIVIPPETLSTPRRFSPNDKEWDKIRMHVRAGREILDGIMARHYERSQMDLREVARIVADTMEHHERWDGLGYPDGKARHDISEMGRLMGVVSPFVSMALPRIYAPAKPLATIVEEIRSFSGVRYDPEVCGLLESFAKTLMGR